MRCTIGSKHFQCGFPFYRFIVEIFIAAGCILYLVPFLCPVPWTSKSSQIALFVFEPYTPPAGWLPDNACGKNGEVVTRSQVVPHKVKNMAVKYTGPNPNRRTWIGFLGSCNMDDDKRIFCTKASVFHPQWNLTYVQANDVLNPSTLRKKVKTKVVFIDIVAVGTAVGVFIWLSIPYYFQPRIKYPGFPWNRRLTFLFSVIIFACGIVSLVTTAMSWSLYRKDLTRYMDVNNFYEPAPCGTARQLKPGVLMKVRSLKGGEYLWAGFAPCYLTMFLGWIYRVVFWDSPTPPGYASNEETQEPEPVGNSTTNGDESEEKHSDAKAPTTTEPVTQLSKELASS